MAKTSHGGVREGSGRKPKSRKNQDFYPDAESYLAAVVSGLTEPDAVRVGAAKALIAYQKAKQRTPLKSQTPKQIREKMEEDIQRVLMEEWEKKANEVRKKYGRTEK